MTIKIPALFVTHQSTVSGTPGGPAVCTSEFLDTLSGAGFELELLTYDFDRSIGSRLARRLVNRAYHRLVPNHVVAQIISICQTKGLNWIFLNFRDSITLAEPLRRELPDVRLVYLSHGADSTDFLHELRSGTSKISAANKTLLGDQLIAETSQREAVDDVICLSEMDENIERWLGAKNVCWVPRVVTSSPIESNPIGTRVGYVGSLSHPPNLEGLELIVDQIEALQVDAEIRVVGGPQGIGDRLNNRRCVTYLGPLADAELLTEAQSWHGFVHPLFCYPRGASTKLATALSWQIPVITTTPGCRGYNLDREQLVIADTPAMFASCINELLTNQDFYTTARNNISCIIKNSHTLADSIALAARFFEVNGD